MNSPADSQEAEIIRSWHTNAKPWSEAIRTRSIVSRRVTDDAILDAVVTVEPRRVLDLGCGEGWLSRALASRGIAAVGFDAVPELIAEAREQGGAEFHVRDYRDIAQGPQMLSSASLRSAFDAIVCNFSLFGDTSTESLLRALPFYLGIPGYLVVQTLHPVTACGGEPYRDGWRAGSWSGFSAAFRDPAPWYFRTLASWFAILRRCGFALLEFREPAAANATAPASVIFICIKEG
jgi:2-polyprenyl-3-methyl-5-hydroxy-6-metoxy-1,4-benzoquinol methylase